jgi:hypothetical protein
MSDRVGGFAQRFEGEVGGDPDFAFRRTGRLGTVVDDPRVTIALGTIALVPKSSKRTKNTTCEQADVRRASVSLPLFPNPAKPEPNRIR